MRFGDLPYGIISGLRNLFYDLDWLPKYKSSLPVICVGNLSVGGNGKTPLVLYLCDLLKQSGKKPVILSRGYGGSLRGPHVVADGDRAVLVGDEPLMLKRRSACPVVIARQRAIGAKIIEEQLLGDIIILDDGFQHRALDRSLDIICAYAGSDSAVQSFQEARLLPFGLFREAKSAGLKRADAIMFNSRSLSPIEDRTASFLQANLPKNIEVFKSHLVIDEIASIDGAKLELSQTSEVDAFCGLAQPEAFFLSLEKYGLKVCNRYVFKDHANFSNQDLMRISNKSQGRPIVCSEKDAIKLEGLNNLSLFVTKTTLVVEPKERFIKFIFENI